MEDALSTSLDSEEEAELKGTVGQSFKPAAREVLNGCHGQRRNF